MRTRFHAEPHVQATELLLQERTPRDVATAHRVPTSSHTAAPSPPMRDLRWRAASPRRTPRRRRRTCCPTAATRDAHGRWLGLQPLARYRGDALARGRDAAMTGAVSSFCATSPDGQVWSAGYQPAAPSRTATMSAFTEDRAEIVAPRRLIVHDAGSRWCRPRTTPRCGASPSPTPATGRARSNSPPTAELVLAPSGGRSRRIRPSPNCSWRPNSSPSPARSLATRRRARRPSQRSGRRTSPSSRASGRRRAGRDRPGALPRPRPRAARGRRRCRAAAAVRHRRAPSSIPIFAFAGGCASRPARTARIAFWTMVADAPGRSARLVDKHRDGAAFDRAGRSPGPRRRCSCTTSGSTRRSRPVPTPGRPPAVRRPGAAPAFGHASAAAARGPAMLWAHGISGDLPIVLVRIDDAEDLGIVRQLLRAHEYWRLKQLAVTS